VWLFALDGTLGPVQSGAPVSRLAAAAAPNPPLAAVATALAESNLERGKQLYTQACVVCHGEDGKGGHGVGAPLTGVTDFAVAFRTVGNGGNSMPAFSASFTAEQIRDVSAY